MLTVMFEDDIFYWCTADLQTDEAGASASKQSIQNSRQVIVSDNVTSLDCLESFLHILIHVLTSLNDTVSPVLPRFMVCMSTNLPSLNVHV